ncbi:unnamed protein product [Lactuca virosa]|uniref:Reverse transcriptase zinc-binding domain-containing protein n=1 Tax=Lactuca virosa TaxID=75947 RepID=A0AAU9N3N5_9ASTR|nr:unnamed protein product [Lactuca virosa]
MGSLPLYFFSIFKAPIGVIESLEKTRSRFLWGGNDEKTKIHWVAWKKIQAKKENGGLGVGSLRALNCALLMKWIWRLKGPLNSIWKSVIMGIHNIHRKPLSSLFKKSINGVWGNIVKVMGDIESLGIAPSNLFFVNVGNGEHTCFWTDVWIGSSPPSDRFPHIFALEKRKSAYIAERNCIDDFNAAWKRKPSTMVEADELSQIHSIINSTELSRERDSWRFTLAPDGEFRVHLIREYIDLKAVTVISLEFE